VITSPWALLRGQEARHCGECKVLVLRLAPILSLVSGMKVSYGAGLPAVSRFVAVQWGGRVEF